jgi:hypothetical protein
MYLNYNIDKIYQLLNESKKWIVSYKKTGVSILLVHSIKLYQKRYLDCIYNFKTFKYHGYEKKKYYSKNSQTLTNKNDLSTHFNY